LETLTRLGVGPEVVVGLCLERSVEMMVALLGALKREGLPALGPGISGRAVGYMLEDAGAGVVLTEQRLEGRLPSFGDRGLDDVDWERISRESEDEPENDVIAENPAIASTLGLDREAERSMVEHRNLVTTHSFVSASGSGRRRRRGGLQFATVSTDHGDLGNTCIYPSLVSGGCLPYLELRGGDRRRPV